MGFAGSLGRELPQATVLVSQDSDWECPDSGPCRLICARGRQRRSGMERALRARRVNPRFPVLMASTSLVALLVASGGSSAWAACKITQNGGSVAAVTNNAATGNCTFDISGLTNGGASIVSLSGSGTVALGANTLTLSNASTTFAGVITDGGLNGGVGGKLALDAGSETLTGANTYRGGTALNGGILVVGNNSALGSGPLSMAPGTTLSFLNANYTIANNITIAGDPSFTPPAGTTQTLSGTIADGASPGMLEMGGAGTLVLSGSNSYSGGTTIASGTLTLSGPGTLGAAAGTTTIDSGGTLDLGGTTQTQAAVNLAGGTIQDGALNAPINATGGIINGIGGAASLAVTAGTTTVEGSNGYTGATSVANGTLDVIGSITATSGVNVNSGGALTGTGTVVAVNVNSGGTLVPGLAGQPSTSMAISGSLTFAPGALYVVYFNSGASTFANVAGLATLNGTVEASFAGGLYLNNKPYTILQSTGLNGAFSGVAVTNLAEFDATLSYSADDVFLNLVAALGAGAPLNTNQANVATAINNDFNGGGTLPGAFLSVFGLSGGNLTNALSKLDGEDATGAERSAFGLMNQFLELLLDPSIAGRGSSSIGASALGFAPDRQENLPDDLALAYAGLLKAPPRQAFDQRWTAWASGFGGSTATNGDPAIGSNNVTTGTYGYAAGLDYRYSPDTALGLSLAGGGTNWNLAQGFGTGRSDAFLAGVYGVTHAGPAYLATALAFANNWFTTNRTALGGDQLTASFQGQSYSARFEGGYRFAIPVEHNAVGVTPYAALQVQDFGTPAYSETDLTGGGFGLSYGAMSGTDTRSELGARLDDLTALADRPLILRAKLAWAHDWVSNPALNAAFVSLPGTGFTVNGAPIPHDSALTSAVAQFFFTPSWSFIAKFDGEFAAGSQTYAGSGTLRHSW
jgi:autotransporter-associated beta strand protein